MFYFLILISSKKYLLFVNRLILIGYMQNKFKMNLKKETLNDKLDLNKIKNP